MVFFKERVLPGDPEIFPIGGKPLGVSYTRGNIYVGNTSWANIQPTRKISTLVLASTQKFSSPKYNF
jgi:hypothetical protein